MSAVSEALSALDAALDDHAVERLLASALDRATADLVSTDADLASSVLALGYRPTMTPEAEPEGLRQARTAALIRRARAVRAPVTPILERAPTLVKALLHGPRTAELTKDVARAAEEVAGTDTDHAFLSALCAWLVVAAEHWGPDYATPLRDRQWYYRLALRTLPDEVRWEAVRVRPNPYLTSLPVPVHVGWLDDLLSERLPATKTLAPRPVTHVVHALMGQGREYPILLACTAKRKGLLNRLQHTPTIRELVDAGVSPETLRDALDEELVVAIAHQDATTLQVGEADGQRPQVPDEGVAMHLGTELAGPWEEADQAAYYAEYCERSSLYPDLAGALVEVAQISADHLVADLGCGTGVSAHAILATLGEKGRLIGVDPAPRMIARATAAFDDP
ncbi:MAG: class I SAM-dependent methyltransferase, partial [Myxococcota bacterium]|nr:class I SAM-dependent methyltransferase [Myxococcota bacterium]